MKYAYYPGCSLHSTGKDYDISAQAVCRALGIELHEIPDWNCCGASSGHSTSKLLSLALPVQDLLTAQEMGMDTAVCCAACYSRLRIANVTMSAGAHSATHDGAGDIVSAVDQAVGRPYRGEVGVKHLLDIVVNDYGLDALREKVEASSSGRSPTEASGDRSSSSGRSPTGSLAGLKAAAYYGCLLVRPAEVVAFDDPENPRSMDDLIEALGAKAVDWPYKIECCGASLSLTRTDIVLKLCRDIYQAAVDNGAECLVVACPLCQSNLDMRQGQVNKKYGTNFDLPVLYFTQLIGLALGLEAKELGLGMGLVSSKALLARINTPAIV